MLKSLSEQVRENARKLWDLDKEIKEVDRTMLSNRVQPIERRMKDIDKEVAAIHRAQDKRTPAQ